MLVVCVVQGGAVNFPALTYPVWRKMYILHFYIIGYLYVQLYIIACAQ